MDRAEFFKEIIKRAGKWYSRILLATLTVAVLMRIIDNELSLLISWLNLSLVLPSLFMIVSVSFARILDLHRYFYTGEAKYTPPSIFSLRLLPHNLVVAIATIAPPAISVSLLFGIEGHNHLQTSLLSSHVLLCSLTVWFYWCVNPYIKGVVSNVAKP